jgi:hypothetical protein
MENHIRLLARQEWTNNQSTIQMDGVRTENTLSLYSYTKVNHSG